MVLNFCIVHRLIKEKNEPIEQSEMSPAVLDCADPTVQELVERIDKVYGNRYNARQYGAFSTDSSRGTFPNKFDTYINDKKSDETLFKELTEDAMNRLYQQAARNNFATGGYLVFADLTKASERFFLIAMIKEKSWILINSLKLEELFNLI